MSSSTTISPIRPQKQETRSQQTSPEAATIETASDSDDMEVIIEFNEQTAQFESHNQDGLQIEKDKQRDQSMSQLEGSGKSRSNRPDTEGEQTKQKEVAQAIVHRNPRSGPDAVIVLKEEKVYNPSQFRIPSLSDRQFSLGKHFSRFSQIHLPSVSMSQPATRDLLTHTLFYQNGMHNYLE